MESKKPLLLCKNEFFNPKWDLGIEVLSGCVWLTHLGSSVDTILEKGDKARLSAARGALIQALAGAEVRVEAARGRSTPRWAR